MSTTRRWFQTVGMQRRPLQAISRSSWRSWESASSSSSSSSSAAVALHQQPHRRRHRHDDGHARRSWSVDAETGVVSLEGQPHFQTVIGLEIHAQLDISTKLFSACPVGTTSTTSTSTTTSRRHHHHQKPNSAVFAFDVAVPGWLPRLSREAVRAAVLSASALQCSLPFISRFERKHYYYADLPLGYQMTQQRWPLAREGVLTCRHHRSAGATHKSKKKRNKIKDNGHSDSDQQDDDTFRVRIERIQLEQDTGKTTVMTNSTTRAQESLVDFNRAGRALIEIVFRPDLRSSVQAATAVETLRSLLKHIGTCDGRMEEGSLRCDLNVSIAPISTKYLITNDDGKNSKDFDDDILCRTGLRVEVKNLNSLRQVQQAAEYEALRQAEAVHEGTPTTQETRTFDVKSGKTVVMRTKEGAKDYRFMPEPDLPPLLLNEDVFGKGMDLETFLEQHLPELPDHAQERLQNEYGLSPYLANVLTGDPPAIGMFDEAIGEANRQLEESNDRTKNQVPEVVANLLCNELFGLVREHEMQHLIEEGLEGGESSVRYSKVTGSQLGEVVALLQEGTISNTMAKQLLKILYSTEEDHASPRDVAKKRGFQLITDPDELAMLCSEVIDGSPDEMERYKLGGKYATKITKFLLGKAMAASKGNAHPERLNEVLAEVLQQVAPPLDNDKEG